MWAQALSHVHFFATPWTVANQSPLSTGFLRWEYWGGLPFPPSGDLPNLRTQHMFPVLQADFLPLCHLGNPITYYCSAIKKSATNTCNSLNLQNIKQKKPDIEESILHDFIHVKFKDRQINTIAPEIRTPVVFGDVWWQGEGHWLERAPRDFCLLEMVWILLWVMGLHRYIPDFPGGTSGKEHTCLCRRYKRRGFDPWVRKIPLEEGMATHTSILAWRIPWTEEPGGLQSMGLQRVGHDWSDLACTHRYIHLSKH